SREIRITELVSESSLWHRLFGRRSMGNYVSDKPLAVIPSKHAWQQAFIWMPANLPIGKYTGVRERTGKIAWIKQRRLRRVRAEFAQDFPGAVEVTPRGGTKASLK